MRKGELPQEYVHQFKRFSYKVENIGYEGRGKIASHMSQYVRALRNIAAGSRELLVEKMHDLYVEASQQKGTILKSLQRVHFVLAWF
jgi:phosphoribosylaminoimidazole carboxylase (NCAIR synthetase)